MSLSQSERRLALTIAEVMGASSALAYAQLSAVEETRMHQLAQARVQLTIALERLNRIIDVPPTAQPVSAETSTPSTSQ